MEIKELTEKDYTESMKLSMYAFQYKIPEDSIASRLEMLKRHTIIGAWENDNLAAKLHIIPFHIYLNDQEWKMGGVAGVATYPEFRRNGYVKRLIREALETMRKEEQIVSLLHPFNIGFYRKFGWDIFTENKMILIEKKDLKFLKDQPGSIIRFQKESHNPDIETVYAQFSKNYIGMLVRDLTWWKNNIYDDSQAAVYYDNSGEAKGYILFEVKERKMDIQEFITLDNEARAGLWNFICQHDSMVDQVSILTSNHEVLPFILPQPKVKTEVTPYFMARIVDAEQCLQKYKFNDGNGKVFIHLEDEYAPWNNGSYLIGSGEVKVFKEKQGSSCIQPPQRGVRMDVNSLTALLFGYKRPMELLELGYINGSESEIAALEKLFPHSKPFFYDFF
ncbi:GNAT family N-acetyltransferase [Neobacillus sp. DY30]|uniref:GNAT family N-acetyltransferase n=1 Tax=Neobacillus sp. DY30 TaxID=3047871 RepID=UPI0024C0892C|nr:GNAT family N-acetyltransferase [Neobacillus sp. DY30]WHY02257.1 GNAT family N-acetyltransferase [Neobacillus sp. DY30]